MEKRIIELTIVVISIIIGVAGVTTSDVYAMQCTNSSNSSFEMILNCTDTIDVRKSTMENMYTDIETFSSLFEDTTIDNIKTEGSETFATLKISLPIVSMQSDVKFSVSENYLLEFLDGKLGGSKLYINLNEINGYDGAKNGGTLVNFTFKIKDVPCFFMGLKCGSASDFRYALDRGLYLMESEAKDLQLEQKSKIMTQKIMLEISPSVETEKESVTVGFRKRF